MRFITRIHLSDCGWKEAYYPGTTIELSDPRTGKPAHTVFSLENTGGKTSFLALVLSCFDTNERRFLKTLIRSNQKFGDYFGTVPAFILVEWDMSDGQPSLLPSKRLVTGQVVVPRGEGAHRDLDRHFFTFRSAPGIEMDDIPAPGLKGFDDRGRLNGYQEVQRWLHELRQNRPGNFQDFSRQSDWKRKLAEEKIDTELLTYQVDFNRSEGGIEDFLDFRSESQFLQKFLGMTVPDKEASAVRNVLAEHVIRLSDLPRLEQRRDALRQLKDKFSPFVDVARAMEAAEEAERRQSLQAAALKTALDNRADLMSRRFDELQGMAAGHESAAAEAEATCRIARIQLASSDVESLRRQHEDAKVLAAAREREREAASTRRHLLRGAVSLREILDDQQRSKKLQEAINAQESDLQPRRDDLCRIGSDLKAALKKGAAELRNRQHSLHTRARELYQAAQVAASEKLSAQATLEAERQQAAKINVDLEHARRFRAQLEAEHILEPGESAEAAARRHVEDAARASEEAGELNSKAETADRNAAQCRDLQNELGAERSGLEGKVQPLRKAVLEGDQMRQRLAFHSTILELAGDTEVDPDSDTVERLLTGAIGKFATGFREDERQQEILQADQESLEATGLASIEADVRVVTEKLREAGIPDAQPYAIYLSTVLQSPQEIRGFAGIDPARFAGVAVPNRNALEKAKRAMVSLPALRRPVTVAIADDTLPPRPTDRFVLLVDEPGAYDSVAAQELRRRVEADLKRISSSIENRRDRIERLEAVRYEVLDWRKRFGNDILSEMRQEVERHQDRIEQIGTELEEVLERIGVAEREARECRKRSIESDKQAHLCTGRSQRAAEHYAQWEQKSGEWRNMQLHHQRKAASAEQLVREKETEFTCLMEQSRRTDDDASKVARDAAELEDEAMNIAYSRSDEGTAGDLDVLRREYKQDLEALKGLEEDRFGQLSARRDEVERALGEKQNRFKVEFSDLVGSQVEAEAVRDGLQEAADDAEAALDTARNNASLAQADAELTAKEYGSESERRARDIQPDSLTDLTSLGSEALARIAPESEEVIIKQETVAQQEANAAQQCHQKAARYKEEAAACRQWVSTLQAIVGREIDSTDPVELPPHDETAGLFDGSVAAFQEARKVHAKARNDVYTSYDFIRRFTNSDVFRRLESEREVVAHLSANDPPAAAANAEKTAKLIEDRLKTIDYDLSRLDDDLQACIAELDRLLSTALHILRQMIRDGRIPDEVPRFGGQPVFRMNANLSRIAIEQRREILRGYIIDLVETNRVPQTGQDIASELVDRMTKALGRNSLGIRLLKPKGEGDTEHMPIEQVTVSGGELLTAAMMIYLVLARLRAEAIQGGASEGGVLIMDNPLGKANKTLLLKTQIGLANSMGIQLFYTTGIQDTNALAEFENIVRLRRIGQSRNSRRIHVEVEAMRAFVDRSTADTTAHSAAAAD